MIDLSNKRELYNIYKKKKSNGKYRTIFAPLDPLYSEQVKLAKKLEEYPVSDIAFAFKKGFATSDVAKLHTNKKWIISLDIKSFFPSIKKESLWFLSDYEKEIATFENRLVFGSPCSPVISNIRMYQIDEYLKDVFNELGLIITRYADDYTISSIDNEVKKPSWRYVDFIRDTLTPFELYLNTKKTKFMFHTDEQKVLGITVNTKTSLNSKIRKVLRSKIHKQNVTEKDKGVISYLKSVNKEQYNKLLTLAY